MTCVICIAAWSLNTHQIWSLSAYPFLSYSLAANFYTPSLCTCHVPQWLPRWMGVGSIHGRRDVATHQRRSFVNRTRGCRDISSPKVPWRIGCHGVSCRAVSGRSYLDFPLNHIRTRIARCARSLVNYVKSFFTGPLFKALVQFRPNDLRGQ